MILLMIMIRIQRNLRLLEGGRKLSKANDLILCTLVSAHGFSQGFFSLPYYMKFSRHVNFANFAIQRKSRNESDANNECREHNMTRELSDSHYVHNKERTNLLRLKRLKITFFTFLMKFQCKWMF